MSMARAPSPAYPAEPRLYGDYYVCHGHVMRRVMTILKPIFFTLTKVDVAKLIIDNYCFELLLDHYYSVKYTVYKLFQTRRGSELYLVAF